MRQALVFSALSLLVASTAAADQLPAPPPTKAARAVKVPALDGKKNHLTMQFVRYTGGTNGEMVVTVANRGKRVESFDATGMYFVPDGDPEKAPQRLGAAGPFRVKDGEGWKQSEKLTLAPGEQKTLHLQVFCIDSHRSSPQASHTFGIAAKRMPKKLRHKIKAGTKDILQKNRGSVAKSKSAIQSHVWKSRDSKWIELEGERANEKAPVKHRNNRNRIDRVQQQRRITY